MSKSKKAAKAAATTPTPEAVATPTPEAVVTTEVTAGATADERKRCPHCNRLMPKARIATNKQPGLKAAALQVLRESTDPAGMTLMQMYEEVLKRGLWEPKDGLTPLATLSASILSSIKDGKSEFVKVSPGHYAAMPSGPASA